MDRRKIVLTGSGILLLALAFCFRSLTFDEPSYKGKSLSAWLKQLTLPINNSTSQSKAHYQEARAALTAMGTNSLPHLLKMIEADDSKFIKVLNEYYLRFFRVNLPIDLASVRQHRASRAITTLGSVALPILPELLRLVREGSTPDIRLHALYSIQHFTDQSAQIAPVLAEVLTSTDYNFLRFHAMPILRSLKLHGHEIVSALIHVLNTSSPYLRAEASMALGDIGPAASNAIPALRRACNDPELYNRLNASAALMKIEAKPRTSHNASSAKTNDYPAAPSQSR